MTDDVHPGADHRVRVAVKLRLHPDTRERVSYWSAKEGISVNEYITEAVSEKIARANGDYDLPTLEIARLGQMLDEMVGISRDVRNLQSVVISMADTIVGLTRGDNYLTEPETGELDESGEPGR